MISREQLEAALKFIAETDHTFAEAKTELERCGWICKRRRAFAFVDPKTGTVDERKARAELHEQVTAAEEARLAAFLEFERLKAERETKFLICEVWRSVEATRRRETV